MIKDHCNYVFIPYIISSVFYRSESTRSLQGQSIITKSIMALIAYPSLSNTSHLSTGTNYSYVHVKPQGNNLYILFLHGFPDTSFVWRRQIDYFAKKGYGLVVPDLLGYGGTDKPKKLEAYRLKKMAGEVVEILDLLGVQTVIGVGHDWYFIPVIKVAAFGAYQSVVTKGSNFLSRLANYHSNRFTKLVWLDVAYKAPTGEIFSPEAINEATEKPLGYPIFGYWLFFRDDDAGRIIDEHVCFSPSTNPSSCLLPL